MGGTTNLLPISSRDVNVNAQSYREGDSKYAHGGTRVNKAIMAAPEAGHYV